MDNNITMISLGRNTQKIASMFKENNKVDVIYVSREKPEGRGYDYLFTISPDGEGEFEHEKYDIKHPQLEKLDEICNQEVIFLLDGSENISGASLSLLSEIKDRNIKIVYMRPDLDFLSDLEKTQEKVTMGVLQNYARSGAVDRIFLFDKAVIASIIGDVPIREYHDVINKYAAYSLNLYLYSSKTETVFGNIGEPPNRYKISFMGLLKDGEEVFFFPLTLSEDGFNYPAFKNYFLFYPSKELDQNPTLLKEIKEELNEINSDFKNVSYGVYSTPNDEEEFKLIVLSTSLVQKTSIRSNND